jgi:hypothetical protein
MEVSSATNVKSMAPKLIPAQSYLASATGKGSTESITYSSTRRDHTSFSLLASLEHIPIHLRSHQEVKRVLRCAKKVLKHGMEERLPPWE